MKLIVPAATLLVAFSVMAAACGSDVGEPASLSDLLDDVKAGRVESIEVDGREVAWTVVDGRKFRTLLEVGDTIHQVLRDEAIEPEDVPPIDGE